MEWHSPESFNVAFGELKDSRRQAILAVQVHCQVLVSSHGSVAQRRPLQGASSLECHRAVACQERPLTENDELPVSMRQNENAPVSGQHSGSHRFVKGAASILCYACRTCFPTMILPRNVPSQPTSGRSPIVN